MEFLLAALVFVAFSVFQSVFLFRCLLAATAQVRQDYVDVLLTQKASFEHALKHAADTQNVGGTPLALAIAQHESQTEYQMKNAEQQYELAKIDLEARRAVPQRPRVVQSADGAFGS